MARKSDGFTENLGDSDIPLGKAAEYPEEYDPSVLFSVARQAKRSELGITKPLPFYGNDLWTAFEVSWLNLSGKPQVAIAELVFPCDSENIIESKSLKLYLNSYNQTQLSDRDELFSRLTQDLSAACGRSVGVTLFTFKEYQQRGIQEFAGNSLDELDVRCSDYHYCPELLDRAAIPDAIERRHSVYSHLFKSNCLITAQPDWASLLIEYRGVSIDGGQLLKYLVSFRNHNEFHEQCVERIYTDLMHYCKPEHLLVYARFTRRGGLDINPWRASNSDAFNNEPVRIARQ